MLTARAHGKHAVCSDCLSLTMHMCVEMHGCTCQVVRVLQLSTGRCTNYMMKVYLPSTVKPLTPVSETKPQSEIKPPCVPD